MLGKFDPSVIDEARSIAIIKKRVILIYWNLIQSSSRIEERVVSMVETLDIALTDFDELLNSGEDAEFL